MTDEIEYAAEDDAFRVEIERNLRWNFVVNVLDGALFWLGLSFAAPSTILPLYVSHLTNNRILIGLVAAIVSSGWYLPQLFTVKYVERLPVKKKLVINVGFFTERLPFILMAASVFLFAGHAPTLALLFFFATLIWRNIGAGAVAIAWQDMVAKVIPVHYRGRLLGIANFAGTAMGLVGASLAAAILGRYPFPVNFGICMSLTALFILASWVALSLTREPPLRSNKPTVPLSEYGHRLPVVVRKDRNFATYLFSRIMAVLGYMGNGFVTVYAVRQWNLTDSQAGLYTTVFMAGQAAANLFAGALADRYGHKLVLEIGQGLSALAMLIAVLAPSPMWMYAVFAVIGSVVAADILSSIMIPMEFAVPDERPMYIGLANTIPGLFSAIAPLFGGWIASRGSYQTLFLTATVFSSLSWAMLHWLVKEPRNAAYGQPDSTGITV
nr:MFS transporter [Chloroflexota bacterium]